MQYKGARETDDLAAFVMENVSMRCVGYCVSLVVVGVVVGGYVAERNLVELLLSSRLFRPTLGEMRSMMVPTNSTEAKREATLVAHGFLASPSRLAPPPPLRLISSPPAPSCASFVADVRLRHPPPSSWRVSSLKT